jgi:phosphoserine phosphatase
MLIDVYDFDGTIYDGDSTFDFIRFCLRRHPKMLLSMPRIAWAGLRMACKRIGLTQFKSELFGVMTHYMCLEAEAERFWQSEKTQAKLGAWFKTTPRDLPIVIASASPEFELCHAAKILGVSNLIGTRADGATGQLIGKNCKGAEKISRIRQMMGEYTVRAMYTDDAKADGPLLEIAEEKYIVTHGQVKKV